MFVRITSFLLLCLLFFPSKVTFGQRVSITVEEIEHFNPYFEDLALEIESFVEAELNKITALRIIERSDFDDIIKELELQKNEAFIDGEVVEQAQLVGAKWIVRFSYEEDNEQLQTQIINIANQEVLCDNTYTIALNGDGKWENPGWNKLSNDLSTCVKQSIGVEAPELRVIEAFQTKGKKNHLLLYSEDARAFEIGSVLSIYFISVKTIDNQKIAYPEALATLQISEIENKNFLNGKLLKGGKAVQQLLAKQTKLYAKPVN